MGDQRNYSSFKASSTVTILDKNRTAATVSSIPDFTNVMYSSIGDCLNEIFSNTKKDYAEKYRSLKAKLENMTLDTSKLSTEDI